MDSYEKRRCDGNLRERKTAPQPAKGQQQVIYGFSPANQKQEPVAGMYLAVTVTLSFIVNWMENHFKVVT